MSKRKRGIEQEQLVQDRSKVWFEKGFLPATNEKSVIINALERFLALMYMKKHPNSSLKDFKVMDIGCGEGTLSHKIATVLLKIGLNLEYYGIDMNPEFISLAREKFKELGVSGVFKVEDCFSECFTLIQGGEGHPNLIIVSHVAYYAPCIIRFVQYLLTQMGSNTVLIMIHASPLSMHAILRKDYESNVISDVAGVIPKIINDNNFDLSEVMFSAVISYEAELVPRIPQIAESQIESLSDRERAMRFLMEFTIQLPLECLPPEKRVRFHTDLKLLISRQINKMIIWASMQIVVQKESIYSLPVSTAVKEFISFRDVAKFSPIHWAAFEGRFEITVRLVEMVGSELVNLPNLGIIVPLYMVALGSSRVKDDDPYKQNFIKIAKFLISKGASTLSRALALEESKRSKDKSLSRVLEEGLNVRLAGALYLPVSEILSVSILQDAYETMPPIFEEGTYFSDELVTQAINSGRFDILYWVQINKPSLLQRTFTYALRSIAHIAVFSKKLTDQQIIEIAKWVDEEVDPLINLSTDKGGNTIVHYLAYQGRVEVLNEIISIYPQLAKALNFKNQSFLDYASNNKKLFGSKLRDLLTWILNHKPKLIKNAHVFIALRNLDIVVLDWLYINMRDLISTKPIVFMGILVTQDIKMFLTWVQKQDPAQITQKYKSINLAEYAAFHGKTEVLDFILENEKHLLTVCSSGILDILDVSFAAKPENGVKTRQWIMEHLGEFRDVTFDRQTIERKISHILSLDPSLGDMSERSMTQKSVGDSHESMVMSTVSQIIRQMKGEEEEKQLMLERKGYFVTLLSVLPDPKIKPFYYRGMYPQNMEDTYADHIANSAQGNDAELPPHCALDQPRLVGMMRI